jgi:hypothetical protein
MLEDKKHWAKVNRRAQTMLLLAGLRWVIVPHVKLEFSSAAGCQGTQFDRGGNFFVAPLPYQVYQAFSR